MCPTEPFLLLNCSKLNHIVFGWQGSAALFNVAKRENGAAGVREDAVNNAIVRQVVQDRTIRGSEHNEVGMQFGSGREDLDRGMAVSNSWFHVRAAGFVRAHFGCEDSKFAHGGRVEPRGQVFALHFIGWGKNVEQDQFRILR